MTVDSLCERYASLADQSHQVRIGKEEFIWRYNAARVVWLRQKCREPESDYTRRLLAIYTKRMVKTATSLVTLDADTISVRSVVADFSGGLLRRAVRPMSSDGFAVDLTDPSHRPDNWFPAYTEMDNTITVHSLTTPLIVQVQYIPVPGDIPPDPVAIVADGEEAIGEILERVLSRQELSTGNLTAYQALVGAETPRREANP
jgi:hypothetical protein